MIREVNKTLGDAFQPVSVEDSDWGDPFTNTRTVRTTMFTQAHITDKQLGINMTSLARGNQAGQLCLIKHVVDVFLFVGLTSAVSHSENAFSISVDVIADQVLMNIYGW